MCVCVCARALVYAKLCASCFVLCALVLCFELCFCAVYIVRYDSDCVRCDLCFLLLGLCVVLCDLRFVLSFFLVYALCAMYMCA